MIRQLLFFILLTAFVSVVHAQGQLTGRVYEDKTTKVLQGIRVEDEKSHTITTTGQDGSFVIKAKIGDVVTFTNFNYHRDTLFLTNLNYVQVFMVLNQTMLQEVNVTNQQIKGNAGFTTQKNPGVLGSNTVKYQLDDNGDAKGGVLLNIPDGTDNRRHEEKVNYEEKQKEKIRRVFNEDSLKIFLPIRGQEMENFIIMYTPDVKTYYSFDFNLPSYLSRCYREFMMIPEEDRKSKSLTQLTPAKN